MASAPVEASSGDPSLEGEYAAFQHALCGAYGAGGITAPGFGPSTLKKFFSEQASMIGFGTEIKSGENSRGAVVGAIGEFIDKTQRNLPTLGKVLVNTKEFAFSVSRDMACVRGSQVVHYKSTAFTRTLEQGKNRMNDVGHFFGSIVSQAKGVTGAKMETSAEVEAEAAHQDPTNELKTESISFCYKYKKEDGEWKIVHLHINVGFGCPECEAAS